jgi:hypothetical protein
MSRYLDTVAMACESLADVVLIAGLSPPAPEDDTSVWWVRDRMTFKSELGVTEPSLWVVRTVATYLPEAAHELRAIAALLRSGAITGSLGPLVRAIVERVGVVFWILDVESADGLERGWRATLNALVCYKEYRKTLDQLGTERTVRNEVAEKHRQLRARVQGWFAPEVDDVQPTDSSLWKRNGSGYPDLTELAAAAMPNDLDLSVRKGVYAAQCGMTHPNIFVLGETVEPLGARGIQFVHRAEDVDKEVRAAFVMFMRGVLVCARYFSVEGEFKALEDRLNTISDSLEAASGKLYEAPN